MVIERKDNRPTILMVIGSLGAGGKERQLMIHLKSLKEQGQFRTVLTVLNPGGSREKEVARYLDKFVRLSKSGIVNLFSAIFTLVQLVRKNDIQLIHSWGSGAWDFISLIVAKWCRIPFLHNGIQSAPAKLDFSNKLSRFSALFADVIVANSSAGLSAFNFKNHPKAKIIYNGMDLNRFSNIRASALENKICMVANFRKEKDHETMIRALMDIKDAFPKIVLILVGHDYGTLSKSELLVNQLGLSDNVKFVTNTLNPEPYIAQSKVCILSTHGEGISNVLLEYMALNKPAIVSDNGGNPEVVLDGVTGYLVSPKSSYEISSRVIELLRDEELAKNMGRAGRNRVEEVFSITKMAAAFNDLYDKLTS